MPRSKRKVELQDPIHNFELYDWKSGIDVINVLDYEGVEADGETDVTDILNDMARWGKTLYFPAGDYRISDTVTFVHDVLADRNARLLVYGGNPAVVLGEDTGVLLNKEIRLPQVINMRTPYWSSGNLGNLIGVQVKAFYASEFHFHRVQEFTEGIRITSNTGNGFSYNRVYPNHLWANSINLHIYPQAPQGWVNENWFFGGRYQLNNKGTNVEGVYQIKLDGAADAQFLPNSNHFFGASVEGQSPQYTIWVKGYANMFYGPRLEAANVAIHWASDGNRHAQYNSVFGGLGIDEGAVVTADEHTDHNVLWRNTNLEIERISIPHKNVLGGLFLQNLNSSTNPSLSIYDTSVDLNEDNLGDVWAVRLGAAYFRGKLKSDTNPRVEIDWANGRVGLGPGGAVALSSYMDYGLDLDSFAFNKEIELTENGDGLILRSANGTLYRITVADNGTVQTNVIEE